MSTGTTSPVTIGAVGKDQIAHDRSEQGLGTSASVGGEQIGHDRSEGGLTP